MLISKFTAPTYASNLLRCYLRSSRIPNGNSLMSPATLPSTDIQVSPGPCLSISKLPKQRREAPDGIGCWNDTPEACALRRSHPSTHGEKYVTALPFMTLAAELETHWRNNSRPCNWYYKTSLIGFYKPRMTFGRKTVQKPSKKTEPCSNPLTF
ncbi:hypothetical protein K443DRAFT_170002 [Laccaria amethystina LaAM-08-1]|uniref:Uncharacterized protein n=1 Tax=Laccaria amethystina LaAM-08-1 TaxID=1095629 RepID=A0A0C9Y1B0_9AGAR|nr:hypothetical protein K443DRAFT_170002 [Laccaria amethystina LaAM-08-1]